ncbi:MAG TPA: L,D-transpeptidase [Prosthecobacter sp.]
MNELFCTFHLACGLALAWAPVSLLQAADEPQAPAGGGLEEATRLQIFLDKAQFGPGKIDGRYGGFTHKALNLYRESLGQEPVPLPSAEKSGKDGAKEDDKKAKADEEAPDLSNKAVHPLPDLKDLDLASITPVFLEYQVTEEDASQVGEVPKEVPAMAKLKWLPYATLAEAVAEKFHCDLKYFHELNPGKSEALKPGDKVKVPNVDPFDARKVKDMALLDLIASEDSDSDKEAKEKSKAKAKSKPKNKGSAKGESPGKPNAESDDAKTTGEDGSRDEGKLLKPSQIAVKVSTQDSMLRLYEDGKLAAAFPVTIGSQQTKSPEGEWKVRGIARLPDFRYDKSFLKTGERGDTTYLLPPGPNNMVGVIWVATNRRGIGLHGTSDPDTIGRSASHGCIRLANWDIVRLASRLRAGAEVSIH